MRPPKEFAKKAAKQVLRDNRGKWFCPSCLVKEVGANKVWTKRDAQRAVDDLFASPGPFEKSHFVCSWCGEEGIRVLRAAPSN